MYLPDYYIFPDPIDADTHVWIYRSVRYSDQRPILLKCLKNPSPTIAALNGLRNEYAITQMIDAPGIIRSIDLLHTPQQMLLLLEDNGSVPIERHPFWGEQGTYFLGQGHGLPIDLFFAIALQLVEIVNQLELHQITHPNFVPQNLWIHPLTQTLTLMNFEQALRSKSDLLPDYQPLGLVLYELLTGLHPVNPTATLQSPDRINFTIPAILSRLVMKILKPTSVQGYQSTQGIQADLARCQAEWQSHRHITAFELGSQERRDRFRVSDRLYGREVEIAMIDELFRKIADHPNKALLQISGASGVGKTAIVNQLKLSRGYLIRGKFDQMNRQLPLSGILQAFRDTNSAGGIGS
jgi:AAA ATPase domain